MVEPVKIMDMAIDLNRMYSPKPARDIKIEITGLRSCEKLFEGLLYAEEGVTETNHEEIYKVICSRKLPKEQLETKIGNLLRMVENKVTEFLRDLLKSTVPTQSYKINHKLATEKM